MDVAQWGYLDGCYKWMDVFMGWDVITLFLNPWYICLLKNLMSHKSDDCQRVINNLNYKIG